MPENPDIGAPAPAWNRLRFEARAAAADEPTLSSYLNSAILAHSTLCQALSFHLAEKLKSPVMSTQQVRHILSDTYDTHRSLVTAAEADMQAVLERDPACRGMLQPFLYFKGFLALRKASPDSMDTRFTPPLASVPASCWTMRPASRLVKQRLLATIVRSCTV